MKNLKLGSGMAGMVVLSALLTACGEDGPPHVFECEDCPLPSRPSDEEDSAHPEAGGAAGSPTSSEI